MKKAVTLSQAMAGIYDELFTDPVVIRDGSGSLERVETTGDKHLKRYKASVRDFLAPEEISRLDRRFRRIAEKRGFKYTGTFADMTVYCDINGIMNKQGLVGFNFQVFTTNSLLDEYTKRWTTSQLSLFSLPLEEGNADDNINEAFEDVLWWLCTMADSEEMLDLFNNTLNIFAKDDELCYESFVVGETNDGTLITVIPGIEKGAASNV